MTRNAETPVDVAGSRDCSSPADWVVIELNIGFWVLATGASAFPVPSLSVQTEVVTAPGAAPQVTDALCDRQTQFQANEAHCFCF